MDVSHDVHVAILPSPGMGHILPLLRLAKRLLAFPGLRVSFLLVSTDAHAYSHLLHPSSMPDGLHVVNLPPVRDISPPDAAVEVRILAIMRESIPSIWSFLSSTPRRNTVLVVDFFGTDLFQVAEELNIPKYMFFTSTARLISLFMYLPTLDREVSGQFVDQLEPMEIPGCDPIPAEDVVDPMQDRTKECYRGILHQASCLPMADGILINTCESMEPVTLTALRENPILRRIPTPSVYPVGPIIDEQGGPLLPRAECLRWLDAQPPSSVLYVSFGSGGTLSDEQITELAHGLQLSRQRFIWVIREPSGSDRSGAFFRAGDGSGNISEYLPDGFLGRTKGVGYVVASWAPQIEILRHKSTAGFLTHCGWNSTIESIVHGVPMIAWPLYAEQKLNATMLAKAMKVAVRAESKAGKDVVERGEIERVVKMMMEGEGGKLMRKRVHDVRDEVLKALDEGGSSYNSLQQVIHEWKHGKYNKKDIFTTQLNELPSPVAPMSLSECAK